MGWRRAAADEARQYDKGEDVGQHAQEIRRDVDGRVAVVDRLPKSEYQARDEGAKRRPLAKDHRRERDVASTVRQVGDERVRVSDREECAGEARAQPARHHTTEETEADVED